MADDPHERELELDIMATISKDELKKETAMDQAFQEFQDVLSHYHDTINGKSAAGAAARAEADNLVAQARKLAEERDAALLRGDDDAAQGLDRQIADCGDKACLLKRRADLLADTVGEHDPAEAAVVIEAGRALVESAQEEIAKRLDALEKHKARYTGAVEEFAGFIRQVAEVRRQAVTLLAQTGRGGEVGQFPRTHGYGPDGFMPKLPHGFDANVDPPTSMFRNLPGINVEATYGRDEQTSEVIVEGGEAMIPRTPHEGGDILTPEQEAALIGPRWLQEA
ncbi:MAG: hypothetical protein ACOY8P_05040 [Thermodesulfobacteriota bacterium]